ncbi:MAG: hypothetical protein UT34_C0001G0353 [candidate division WS6 bacterium GW2011_GWF2_39_15]|uniref:Uncharacterized protein n=1 Tax=candidate division WS6 bacterium GW2011_GWF2_39_15 TaxID=1619100 RepID=A0A0G0MT26_9BACT|nr:MAG: hypothetical protein UT34_C0001G0353 [candidate division WS6 bacterium GW2011_GWF2_39_15]
MPSNQQDFGNSSTPRESLEHKAISPEDEPHITRTTVPFDGTIHNLGDNIVEPDEFHFEKLLTSQQLAECIARRVKTESIHLGAAAVFASLGGVAFGKIVDKIFETYMQTSHLTFSSILTPENAVAGVLALSAIALSSVAVREYGSEFRDSVLEQEEIKGEA